jgi:small subunit ribosomal protein S9
VTEQPPQDDQQPEEVETPAAEAPEEPAEPEAPAEPAPAEEPVAEEAPAEEPAPAAEPVAEEAPAEPVAEEPAPAAEPVAEEAPAAAPAAEAPAAEEAEELLPETPRVKPEIPGADLEPDIVLDAEAVRGEYDEADEDAEGAPTAEGEEAEPVAQPISDAMIDLAAGARYPGTGKRKTSVARVILRPGDGSYTVNGKTLEDFFPRATLQRNIRQPLEAVGYESRMDVVVKIHGGGVSSQAGALRHGISRALILADPNLRGELKRRGFLTRDPRVKERKKAGLKKARKRPQFSKR